MYIITAIIFSCALVTVDASLYDFTKVGECILGYNPWFQLFRHGCYCGFGNHGDVAPEDDYDECCKKHDECYGNLEKKPKQCPNLLAEYLTPYWFHCENEHVYCYVDPPFSWIPWWKPCGEGLCRCDSDMMECWKNVTKNSNDTTGKPDKRYCYKNESTLPYRQDPTWFDYVESLVDFYRDLNRHKYDDAEKARIQRELDEERLNAIQEWAKGHTRYPPRKWEPDENDINPLPKQPWTWKYQHPNQLPQASRQLLPWQQRRPDHRDWNPPDFDDDNEV